MRLRHSLLFLFLVVGSISQSIDEEESVHMPEGSANGSVDDEDIEGSALPPDTQYATSPVVHPKLTTPATIRETSQEETRAETSRATTTLVRQHKIQSFATSTPRISIQPQGETSSSTSFLNSGGVLVGLSVVLAIVLIIIVVIICCCKKKKGYAPAKQDSHDC